MMSRTLVVVVISLLTLSCGKKSPSEPSGPVAPTTVSGYVSQAVTLGAAQTTSTSRTGAPPAGAGGPTATVISPTPASSGGANLLTVLGSAPFQTVFVSVGGTSQVNDYLQVDLPAPATSLDLAVTYPSSLAVPNFELRVQVVAPGGTVGPVATVPKSVSTSRIEMVGIVYTTFGINPSNPTGPGIYGPPASGATVSSSLDSQTTTTNANGAFDLLTNTASTAGACFTLTISRPGSPTYSTQGWAGNAQDGVRGPGGTVIFSLSPPMPTLTRTCN
jgi:hypothetical protein